MNISLPVGLAKIQVTHVEWAGGAGVRLRWDAGVGMQQALPWWRVFPQPPGSPARIQATINGVTVVPGCGGSSISLPTTVAAVVPTPEPTSLALSAPACSFVYSSHMTPTLTTALPFTSIIAAGQLSLTGALLANTTASAYTVTIGGQACPVVSVTEVNATNGTYTLNCSLPELPAGRWPLVVGVEGYGNLRPALLPASTSPNMTLQYGVAITGVTAVVTSGTAPIARASWFGGSLITLTGWGFAPLANSSAPAAATRSNRVTYSSGFMNIAGVTITVLAANSTSLTLQLGRFWLPGLTQPSSYSTSSPTSNAASFTLAVIDQPLVPNWGSPVVTSSQSFSLTMHALWTPRLLVVTPLAGGPTATGTLNITWSLGIGSISGLVAPAAGASLVSRVQLQAGADMYNCTSPTTNFTSLGTANYSESMSCALPAYLPAANYTIWVCVEPVGCGVATSFYQVGLTVSGLTPASGSAAGGMNITVSGEGFSATPADVLVQLGGIPCHVLATTPADLTCTLGRAPSLPAAASDLQLSVRPSINASTAEYPAITFRIDPAVTPRLASATPWRGSTAGGTAIQLVGSGFPTNLAAGSVVARIGNSTCSSLTVVNSTLITCTTADPGYKPAGPLPIQLLFSGTGAAWSASNVSYHYVDLWSRPSTWDGKPPPVEGDSVFIPAGTTVLLDVSTPLLGAVVCEGNLIFDDSPRADELQLNAGYVIVKGGNLTIGTADAPYPNRARITL